MADQMDGKGRPPKRRSGLTRGQKGLIAAAAVLAVALAGVLAWQSLFVRPDLNTGKTEPQETEEPTDPVEEIDWGEGTRPRSDGERKSQDYYTVLILGRDTGGGGNTDTMLLASYDVTNQKATVMSIPRDTMVNVSWDIKKINSVYNTYGGGDRGIQALYKEISQLVGFEPDYQVIVEWEAVGEIVDAMGGVWFDVPRNMNYDDPLQNLHIHQEKGYRLLTGEDAMEVLRYRHDNRKNGVTLGYPEGDVGRIKTQQAFLKAMVEQLLKVENVPKVRQFIQVFQDNVETNLTFQNILWFAQAAFLGGLKAENVEFVTMPGNSSAYAYSASISKANGEYSEASYVTPYPNELLELVNTKLSPYAEVFTRSDLDMMTVNSDGSVSSSTGHVEDSNATHPRSHWQAQWTPQEPEEETPPEGETVSDDLLEALMRGLIWALRTSSKDLQNDDARSDLMWAGTLAGDKLFRLGKRCTYPCRRAALQLMEHTRHSRTDCLAVLQRAACRRVCIEQPARAARLARRVWEASGPTEQALAQAGTEALSSFLQELGLPSRLEDLGLEQASLPPQSAQGKNLWVYTA